MSHRNVVWEQLEDLAENARRADAFIHNADTLDTETAQKIDAIETWFDNVAHDMEEGHTLDYVSRRAEIKALLPVE